MIDGIVLFDRYVDLLTPILTQFSYSGQLDEQCNIIFNETFVKRDILEEGLEEDEQDPNFKDKDFQKIRVGVIDPIYTEIKDFQLDHSRTFLAKKLRNFKSIAKDANDEKNNTEKLKKAVLEQKKLKKYKIHLLLAMHLQRTMQKPVSLSLLEMEQVIYMLISRVV